MIKKYGTVSLWVDDFESCLYFYEDVMRLDLITRPGEVPHFRVGESMLVLVKGIFCPPDGAFPPDFPQLSFEVDNLDEVVSYLKDRGVDVIGNIEERRDSRWIKLHDPAGNLIAVVEVKS